MTVKRHCQLATLSFRSRT